MVFTLYDRLCHKHVKSKGKNYLVLFLMSPLLNLWELCPLPWGKYVYMSQYSGAEGGVTRCFHWLRCGCITTLCSVNGISLRDLTYRSIWRDSNASSSCPKLLSQCRSAVQSIAVTEECYKITTNSDGVTGVPFGVILPSRRRRFCFSGDPSDGDTLSK